MKTFKQLINEVYKNDIGLKDRITPELFSGEGFNKPTKSIIPGHVILTRQIAPGYVGHVWAAPEKQQDGSTLYRKKFFVGANIKPGNNNEVIYSDFTTSGVGGGHGPHAYFDIMSGRAARGEDGKPRYGVLVHDSMSPGAIKLMNSVNKQYGNRIIRHTYTPEPGEPERGTAKHYIHGVHWSTKTPLNLASVGPISIVQFANPKHRVKE